MEKQSSYFYKSRIYIDLSDEELYGKNFEQLLRMDLQTSL